MVSKLAAAGVLAAAMAVLVPTPAPAQVPQPVIGIKALHMGETTLQQNHFTYAVSAGSSVDDAAVIINFADHPVEVDTYAADRQPAAASLPPRQINRLPGSACGLPFATNISPCRPKLKWRSHFTCKSRPLQARGIRGRGGRGLHAVDDGLWEPAHRADPRSPDRPGQHPGRFAPRGSSWSAAGASDALGHGLLGRGP